MGFTCCSGERYTKDEEPLDTSLQPLPNKHKSNFLCEDPGKGVEMPSRPIYSPMVRGVPKTFYDDPEPPIELFYISHDKFHADWKGSITFAWKSATTQILPYLITSLAEDKLYTLVFSRAFAGKRIAGTDISNMLVMKKFVSKIKDEKIFCANLAAFIKQATIEGLEPIGCVNDFRNSHTFYMYFLQTYNAATEDVIYTDLSWYTCQSLKARDKNEIGIVLTEWAKEKDIYYRISFPVFSDSFSEVLFQAIVLEQCDTGRVVNYYVEESPKKEELCRDINVEHEFVGFMFDVRQSYIVYNIETEDVANQ